MTVDRADQRLLRRPSQPFNDAFAVLSMWLRRWSAWDAGTAFYAVADCRRSLSATSVTMVIVQ